MKADIEVTCFRENVAKDAHHSDLSNSLDGMKMGEKNDDITWTEASARVSTTDDMETVNVQNGKNVTMAMACLLALPWSEASSTLQISRKPSKQITYYG